MLPVASKGIHVAAVKFPKRPRPEGWDPRKYSLRELRQQEILAEESWAKELHRLILRHRDNY